MITKQLPCARSYSYSVIDGVNDILMHSDLVCRRHVCDYMVNIVSLIKAFIKNCTVPDPNVVCCGDNLLNYRFDPFLSPECCLTPSNLNKDIFMCIAPFNRSEGTMGPLLRAVEDYGRMCHMTGANYCIKISCLKKMIISSGIGERIGSSMIVFLRKWIVDNLLRSGSKIYCEGESSLEDWSLDETTAFACVMWLMCNHMMRGIEFLTVCSSDDSENNTIQSSLESVVKSLLCKCISRWYKHGGLAFCMYRMVYMLSTAKAAALSSADSIGSDYDSIEAEKQNISCFSVFTCTGCLSKQKGSSAVRLVSCKKQIIQCCSSSKNISNLVCKILSHVEEPYGLMNIRLDACCNVSDVKYFVGIREDIVKKVISISKEIFYACGVCCSVKELSFILRTSARCVSQELENMKHASKDSFTIRYSSYDMCMLYGWIDCVNDGADIIILKEQRLIEFVDYLVGCYSSTGTKYELSKLVSLIKYRASRCYLNKERKSLVDALMGPICMLVRKYIVESAIKIERVCRWLRISISYGCNIQFQQFHRNMLFDESCLQRKFPKYYSCLGMVLLPNEVWRCK